MEPMTMTDLEKNFREKNNNKEQYNSMLFKDYVWSAYGLDMCFKAYLSFVISIFKNTNNKNHPALSPIETTKANITWISWAL